MIIDELRKYRIGPFAIFDFAGSFIIAYVMSFFLEKYINQRRIIASVIPLAVLTHLVFNIDTPLNKMIFDEQNIYALFIFISSIYFMVV